MSNSAHPEGVRILAVTGIMPLGGTSTFLVNLASGLRSLGASLEVVVMCHEATYKEELTAAGGRLHTVSRLDSIFEDRIARVYRIAADVQPRAVVSCLSAESFEILRLTPPGVVKIGVIQSDDPGPYRMTALYAKWIDAMVGVSDRIREKIAAKSEFAAARVVGIPYGIAFDAPVARRLASASPLRIIYAGRLIEEQKRISRLADVVQRLADGTGRFEFTIAGSGLGEGWLRENIGGSPGVVFAGELSNAQTRAAFRDHDVFLLLSDYEGLPLSLLEAMGEGCVPVVSDLESGIRQVVAEDCGIRVPTGDVDAAVAALRVLDSDRQLCARMGNAAAGFVRAEYSAERMACRFLDLARAADPPSRWKPLRYVPMPIDIADRWRYAYPLRMLRRIRKRLFSRGPDES